jgi:hypothetical protein
MRRGKRLPDLAARAALYDSGAWGRWNKPELQTTAMKTIDPRLRKRENLLGYASRTEMRR